MTVTKQSPVDRLASHFPGWAVRRAVAKHNLEQINAQLRRYPGYGGGNPERRQNLPMLRQGLEDTTINYGDYNNMRAKSMQLYRNDPFTRSIVDTIIRYMGQSRPSAKTSDTEWNKRADEYFNERWWKIADARRRPGVDFGTLQTLWDRMSWMQGDSLYAIWQDALYPYEGIQIQTPRKMHSDQKVVNGVRIQKAAPHRITHFYVRDELSPRHSLTDKKDFTRFRQSEVFYAPARAWRLSMLRGVPELHSVIDALEAFDKTNCNVASKIQFESMLWTVERKNSITNGKTRFATGPDGADTEYTKAEYGMRVKTTDDPSKDFVISGLDNPGAQHVPYMEFAARIISAGIGLPYDIVMHVYNSSYTASRAARCDLKAFVMERWAHRNKVFCQPIYNWRIASAIRRGDLDPAPVNQKTGISEWYKCDWSVPTFEQIDRVKDSKGDQSEWGMAQLSLEDMARRRDSTRAKQLDAHDEDIAEMQRRAKTLGVTLDVYMGQFFKAAKPENKV